MYAFIGGVLTEYEHLIRTKDHMDRVVTSAHQQFHSHSVNLVYCFMILGGYVPTMCLYKYVHQFARLLPIVWSNSITTLQRGINLTTYYLYPDWIGITCSK